MLGYLRPEWPGRWASFLSGAVPSSGVAAQGSQTTQHTGLCTHPGSWASGGGAAVFWKGPGVQVLEGTQCTVEPIYLLSCDMVSHLITGTYF